ncbi:MAG: amidohydrolase [Desulfobacterales bacterium]|nr:amidohydrolase [Desulfobacterales bacterium]
MKFDTIIHNGIIVTVNPDFEIIDDGIICVKDGIIDRIITKKPDQSGTESKEVIDAKGGIIMPGLINTHTHLPMTLFRGLADDLPLLVWLNRHIFPAEATHINSETVFYGSLLACAEMLLSGTTTCCDGYFHEHDVARAVHRSGIRAVLAQGVIDFPAPGVPDPVKNIETAVQFAEQWQAVSPLITPSIFCHSPYTCSDKTLMAAKNESSKRNLLLQIHVAETKTELEQIQTGHNKTPVEYLDSLDFLDERTLLAHAIWLYDEDIDIVQNRESTISVTTESEMKLASGIAPISKFLKAGLTVGLGTDSTASNNNLDMFQEMDMTAKLHKVNQLDPTVMDAKTVIKLATIEGAKAIGLGSITGSLEAGKQADIIILDTNAPHLTPLYHPESHIVYAAQGPDVKDVLVAGEVLVRDRKLLSLDAEDIMAKANEIGKIILK